MTGGVEGVRTGKLGDRVFSADDVGVEVLVAEELGVGILGAGLSGLELVLATGIGVD